ncbi:hypothetical protein [Candidatus Stoquefichus massiliensis]|uniref:hypothetical protein n=1 Tax=Candidatus Stoquefichus massiliensis TaxID=1470350 RepID=UPI000486EFA2|nr:hypothetical protein [Candidatus Stoquefichus massiliensis]
MINNDHFYKSEMLILSQLKKQDATIDDLYLTFQSVNLNQLNNGSLLTSIFFFLESHLISQYSHNNTIYYHIESAGLVRLDTLKRRYHEIQNTIEELL